MAVEPITLTDTQITRAQISLSLAADSLLIAGHVDPLRRAARIKLALDDLSTAALAMGLRIEHAAGSEVAA